MRQQSHHTNSLFLSAPPQNTSNGSNARWAVILAGAGERAPGALTPAPLRLLRPKHFCRMPGSEIVIDQTRKQTALVFPPERTLFVVSREHLSYYEEVLADVPPKNLIVQPQDDGSLFSVFYAALRLKEMNPAAVLTFFPADFQTADVRQFMTRVESALAAVSSKPELILLGTKAETPDPNREWIEIDPAAPVNEALDVWRVRRFRQSVKSAEARELWSKGALWNSSVMVGTAATFLRTIRRAAPEVYEQFAEAASKIGTPGEHRAIEKVFYSNYRDTDFAKDVLAKSVNQLSVIPVPGSKSSAASVERTVSQLRPEKHLKPARKYRFAQMGI